MAASQTLAISCLFVEIIFLHLLTSARAAESTRFALLIGNSDYPTAVGQLSNPTNDVELVRRALLQIGFADADIAVVKNATNVEMRKSFDAFAKRVQSGGTGAISFFYYSGHGAANDQHENYLIPVDVPELSTTDFWYHAVRLHDLIDALNVMAPHAEHFIIFDACRNSLILKNPGHKSIVQAKGFEPVGIFGGMLIAFATADGKLASDEGEGAGPYARALAEEIVKPDEEAIPVFRRVQLRVLKTTGQEPWTEWGSMSEVYFAGQKATDTITSSSSDAASRSSLRVALSQCRQMNVIEIVDSG